MDNKISACEEMLALVIGTKVPFKGDEKYDHAFEKLEKVKFNISCIDCSKRGIKARGFLERDPMAVKLCADRIQLKDVKVLVDHEIVHAYDYSLGRCDFSTGKGLAYSEVRAAREAECSGWFLHDYFRVSCIKDQATRSTEKIFSSGAEGFVNEVFDSAMRDLEPYAPSSSSSS
mmetsp:Transcript_1049/g.2210  ORF Transcript_1049/g.2210 Transcript_1049/m.2210 type:complete len:174 (-) Transcript_1049:24-545(-)